MFPSWGNDDDGAEDVERRVTEVRSGMFLHLLQTFQYIEFFTCGESGIVRCVDGARMASLFRAKDVEACHRGTTTIKNGGVLIFRHSAT